MTDNARMQNKPGFSVAEHSDEQVRAAAASEYAKWQRRVVKYGVGPAYRGRVEIVSVKGKPVFWSMRVSDTSNLIAQFIIDDGTGNGPRLVRAGEMHAATRRIFDSLTTRQYESITLVSEQGEQPLRRRAS